MLKNQERVKGYLPTEAEEKLLLVLGNPEKRHGKVSEICEEAGVSRDTYYRVTKKAGFRELLTELNIRLVQGYLNPVIKQVYQDAINPNNKQRFHQQRMMLEMGRYLGKDVVEGVIGRGSSLTINIGHNNEDKKTIDIGSAED